MTKIDVFYRDGANYKHHLGIGLSDKVTRVVEKAIGKKIGQLDTADGAEVEYDRVLGLTREEFHRLLGTDYDPELDHPFVTLYPFDEATGTIVHTIGE